MADWGYDASENSDWIDERDGSLVIHKRKPKSGLHRGGYTTDGTPVCECGESREYAFTNRASGVHYYGRASDSRLKDEDSLCFMSFLVKPKENVRLFGGDIRRGSDERDLVYNKR